jgi:hypothetical protein
MRYERKLAVFYTIFHNDTPAIRHASVKDYLESFPPMAQQPLVGQGLLFIKAARSHSDTAQSVRLLWTSDQPDAETCTSQHTTLTTDRHASEKNYL